MQQSLKAIILLSVSVLVSCSGPAKKAKDTPNEGRIRIASDESFRYILNATIDTYQAAYKRTRFDTSFVPEAMAFKMLMEDSARVICATRKLTDKEMESFTARKVTPDQLEFATDAVAIIINRANMDSTFSLQRLAAILAGKEANWANGRPIVPVFDQASGANYNYMVSHLQLNSPLASSVVAAGSNPKVIDYVRTNKDAIGFIGVGWISDAENPKSIRFRSEVRVGSISRVHPLVPDSAFQPYQAYLALHKYPLTRTVYLISGDFYTGLATGFLSWATSDKGQRIVLKSGLMPARGVVRVVDFK